jgi:gliding motility-associated-like protein
MPESTVSPAPLVITADNKIKTVGDVNPPLTATYQRFVNDDSPAQLTAGVQISTTATTASPVGQYPITVTGAASPDYTISYVDGMLTIIPHLVIPNAFTPNGDGINDTWNIKFIDFYPQCTVKVFTRYGQNVYSSTGYGVPWDGSYKGGRLPVSTYYYIIDLKNGSPPLSGFITIIR